MVCHAPNRYDLTFYHSMRNPVVVVVGTGFIGPVHVEALRRLGVRVKGMLGSTPEKSHAAAARLGL